MIQILGLIKRSTRKLKAYFCCLIIFCNSTTISQIVIEDSGMLDPLLISYFLNTDDLVKRINGTMPASVLLDIIKFILFS
ncbi:hypothetical protein HZS_6569 [Henneguya salminicola]|nr:hypothetical protein HZS_6569 [Henneguya salminicola]